MNPEFKQWLDAVDAVIISRLGVGREDLPDVDSWSMWDSGMTPEEGAEEIMAEAVEEMGFSMEDFYDV